jgi:hypothetical protein
MAPKPLNEQLMGLGIQKKVLETAFLILNRVSVGEPWLKMLQVELEKISEKSVAVIDFSGERLIVHDIIQRTFTDDGTGGGHIPPSAIRYLMIDPSYAKYGDKEWKTLDRRETTRCVNDIFAYLVSMQSRTPVELRLKGEIMQKNIQKIAGGNAFLLMETEGYEKYYHRAFRCRAIRDALVVTSAIMRYRLEHDDLPEQLDQLIQAGYLNSLPADPFSGRSFVYRKADKDFLLYSLGPDFDDDGGTRSNRNDDVVNGDDVFWPVVDDQL